MSDLELNELNRVRNFLWTPEDAANLAPLYKVAEGCLGPLVDHFYATLQQTPELAKVLGDSSRIPQLKKTQASHWLGLLRDGPNDAYQQRALRVGAAHARIGLSPAWYLSTYSLILNGFSKAVIERYWWKSNRLQGLLSTLNRLVFNDMALALSAYETDHDGITADIRHREQSVGNLRQLSATIISMNDATASLAELVRNSHLVAESGDSIARSAQEMVNAVEDISRNSQAAAVDAEEAHMVVTDGTNNAEAARKAITLISDAVADTAGSVDDLAMASEQIGQILAVIENIANQTNLLALNATIEAARAGEAGKGFAVVANEVKNLANQTSKSTEDIAQKIDALRRGMDSIRQTMNRSQDAVQSGERAIDATVEKINQMSSQITNVAAKIQEISYILHQQQDASEVIAGRIGSVADMASANNTLVRTVSHAIQTSNTHISNSATQWFHDGSSRGLCELAKIDHVLFKKRVVDVLMGDGEWHSHEVPDDHQCRLGKWYDTVKDPRLTGNPHFRRLEVPHEVVHASAKAALDAYYRQDMDGALVHLREMNEASSNVLSILDELSRSIDKTDANTLAAQ
ncbi:methyl-accepting chemotaxis protein [Insolitispirillum peregrinum]|uniref:Methyl-accepting chemotaxis protein n=1 Tax=Insolitispirillum peregrinum TaxID=80876 RepID=A0A1N7MD46_9PROT|nr:methyl-accepting chemotaxis protein [Insolitispirillum peregrinum]SIS83911.1 methyl-accepting chemotaxis protein [Insolitispirillum peregrinum]